MIRQYYRNGLRIIWDWGRYVRKLDANRRDYDEKKMILSNIVSSKWNEDEYTRNLEESTSREAKPGDSVIDEKEKST